MPCASIVKLNDECLSNKVAPKTIIMYRIVVYILYQFAELAAGPTATSYINHSSKQSLLECTVLIGTRTPHGLM